MVFGENVSKAKGRVAHGGKVKIVQRRLNTFTEKSAQVQDLMPNTESDCINYDLAEMGDKEHYDCQ